MAENPHLQLVSSDVLKERLAAERADPSATASSLGSGSDDARRQYLLATALRSTFSSDDVRNQVGDTGLQAFLANDCVRVIGPDGVRHWSLDDRVRRTFLSELGKDLKSLAKSHTASDAVERMLLAFALRNPPKVEDMTLEELYATTRVAEWLNPDEFGIPDPWLVRARIDKLGLLAPFHKLADHFVGRKHELRELSDYVDFIPTEGILESVGRSLRGFSLRRRPPLLLHGPGGVGKSALLARFVLDHVDRSEQLPFVYLNFDRPDLVPQEPATLLIEALGQLIAQLPELRSIGEALRDGLVSEVSTQQAGESTVEHYLDQFANAVRPHLGPQTKMLVIADTFEEVQRRGTSATRSLFRWLDALQQRLDSLRTVVAGRAEIREFKTNPLEIKAFDDEIAHAFLSHELEDLNIDKDLLTMVIDRIGNNPLTLKLSAQVIRLDGAETLRNVKTRGSLFRKLREEEVQGQLYRRILAHLPHPDLQKIANPGLILRRITPEIISEVLAGPCELDVADPGRAEEIYDMLSREASLVEPTGDGTALTHRQDVRRAMLKWMEEDDKERVDKIHRRAIKYHANRDSDVDRAEEIYHRLALSQAASTLDERWSDSAGQLVAPAIEELPPTSQVYLAARLGIRLDPAIEQAADDDTWVRHAQRSATKELELGFPEVALEILRERRRYDGTSFLPTLEGRALLEINDPKAAKKVVDSALLVGPGSSAPPATVDLLLLAADVSEQLGLAEEALDYIDQARSLADLAADRMMMLRIGTSELRLLRWMGKEDSKRRQALADDVMNLAEDVTRRQWRSEPDLLHALAAEVGGEDAVIFEKALDIVGVGEIADSDDPVLVEIMAEWDDDFSQSPQRVDVSLLEAAQSMDEGETWEEWFKGQTAVQKGRNLSNLSKKYFRSNTSLRKSVSDLYRQQSDARRFKS